MRGMKLGLARGAVFIGAALGMSSAFAAAGVAAADVTALSPEVTYRREAAPPRIPALNTYLGYNVVVRNTDGNTINNVVFEGTLTVLDQGEVASFDSTLSDPRCAVVSPPPPNAYGNSITIRCAIGQLKGLGQLNNSTLLSIFFNAPYEDTTPRIPALVERDHAGFSGIIITAEGALKGNSPNDSVDFWPLATATSTPDRCPKDPLVATDPTTLETLNATSYPCVKIGLGTPNATQVKSAVPKKIGSFFSFFTGDGGIPGLLPNDRFTTTAKVPATQILTASISEQKEGEFLLGTCPRFNECTSTTIAIKDLSSPPVTATFPTATPLAILLRIDSLNILKGVRIQEVVVSYTDDEGNLTPVVQPCATSGGVPVANTTGIPCVAKRTHYKTRGTTGWDGQVWTPDLDGDFEIAVLNTKNGKLDAY